MNIQKDLPPLDLTLPPQGKPTLHVGGSLMAETNIIGLTLQQAVDKMVMNHVGAQTDSLVNRTGRNPG